MKAEELRSNLRRFAGRAVSVLGGQSYRYDETDFLRIGCAKPALGRAP